MTPKVTYNIGFARKSFLFGAPNAGDKIILSGLPQAGSGPNYEFTYVAAAPGANEFSSISELAALIDALNDVKAEVISMSIKVTSLVSGKAMNNATITGTGVYAALNLSLSSIVEYIFDNYSAQFNQGWEPEEYPFKNPFTKDRSWKKFGVYYKSTIGYESIPYLELNLNIRRFLGKNITDLYFYPNIDGPERYAVDVDSNIEENDDDTAMEYTDVEINFRGLVCVPTPLNQPIGYAGDRSHTIAQLASNTIAELSGA